MSTDITSLRGTITYTHHQCSTSSTTQTYTDSSLSTSNAAAVSTEIVVNGQTVSTVQGGCYTTPYYYCKIHYPGSSYSEYCDGYYIEDGKGSNPNSTAVLTWYKCSKCSYRQLGGTWNGHSRTVTTPAYDKNEYRDSPSGTILATYYKKSCGYTNGTVVSATITY